MFDPDRIVIQAASTEQDTGMIEVLLGKVLRMVHARESDIHIVSGEPAFGWKFYTLTIDRTVAKRIAQLPESAILQVKGDSLEQKFVNWLNRPVKANNFEEKIHFSLLSDLMSSRYGLF
ncbi:MAG TPA: hypothetical protein VE692_02315 [Nitrososphaera sp.]|jgi:hypothetical protein|nr:hypothetical protein [Nitrososphaera sp.]